MTLNEYQLLAVKTAQAPAAGTDPKVLALLGLAGEAGELLSEFKKHLRDGESHKLFPARVSEELGDLLWYVARVAGLFELDLEDVAINNIEKTEDRWGSSTANSRQLGAATTFDKGYAAGERFERQFDVRMEEFVDGSVTKTRMFVGTSKTGSDLTDNAYEGDGYRFHDVFHLACVAVLGWSPVMRALLGLKRKSRPEVDEVDDGARAIVIEEGISAMSFAYAKDMNHFESVVTVDYELLSIIRKTCSHLEVGRCSSREWQEVILQAFGAWRSMANNGKGTLHLDLDQRKITYSNQF